MGGEREGGSVCGQAIKRRRNSFSFARAGWFTELNPWFSSARSSYTPTSKTRSFVPLLSTTTVCYDFRNQSLPLEGCCAARAHSSAMMRGIFGVLAMFLVQVCVNGEAICFHLYLCSSCCSTRTWCFLLPASRAQHTSHTLQHLQNTREDQRYLCCC